MVNQNIPRTCRLVPTTNFLAIRGFLFKRFVFLRLIAFVALLFGVAQPNATLADSSPSLAALAAYLCSTPLQGELAGMESGTGAYAVQASGEATSPIFLEAYDLAGERALEECEEMQAEAQRQRAISDIQACKKRGEVYGMGSSDLWCERNFHTNAYYLVRGCYPEIKDNSELPYDCKIVQTSCRYNPVETYSCKSEAIGGVYSASTCGIILEFYPSEAACILDGSEPGLPVLTTSSPK